MSTVDATQFEAYRPLMFSIAYRMLGSVTEAGDVARGLHWPVATRTRADCPGRTLRATAASRTPRVARTGVPGAAGAVDPRRARGVLVARGLRLPIRRDRRDRRQE